MPSPSTKRLPVGIAYIRTSTGRQQLGPQAQRHRIRQWAESQGVQIAGWHVEAISGAEAPERRPALLSALEALADHPGAHLVVATRDRLARDVHHAGLIERMCAAHGARCVAVDGVPSDEGPYGRFVRVLLDGVAELERGQNVMRVRAAQAVKRQRGECLGVVPWGMRKGRDGKTLEWEPTELRAADIALQLAAEGLSTYAISQLLWAQGCRSRKGTRIHRDQVRHMLLRYGACFAAGVRSSPGPTPPGLPALRRPHEVPSDADSSAHPKVGVAYVRCSKDRQELGPVAQRSRIRQWAQLHGIQIAAWHVEVISGAADVDRRPALLEAISDLGRFPGAQLLVASRDRLARDVHIAGLIDQMCRNKGGACLTTDGLSADDGPYGRFVRTVFDSVAELERAQLIARVLAAHEVKRQRNECPGRSPYGFRRGPDGKTLEWEPAELQVIDIVLQLDQEGLTPNYIANELRAQGFQSRTGRPLCPPSIRRILEVYGPAYHAGLRSLKRGSGSVEATSASRRVASARSHSTSAAGSLSPKRRTCRTRQPHPSSCRLRWSVL